MFQRPAKTRTTSEPSKRAAPTRRTSATDSTGTPQKQANVPTHLSIPRQWPTWSTSQSTTEQTTTVNTNINSNDSTTMQRWMNETAQQSPWNNISGVEAGREEQMAEAEEGNGGMQRGRSAAGTWGSRSE